MSTDWCKENYEKSVTSHAWAATPYDAGWEGSAKYGEDLPASAELRAIFDEEMALGAVPDWAVEIIRRMIGPLPMCGHYAFPRPLIQIAEAIGQEKAAAFVCGCYTADSARKILMSTYVYCLDAWRKHAPPDAAKAELALRVGAPLVGAQGGHEGRPYGKDWPAIFDAIARTLGAPTPPKQAAVRRLVHRLRWWIKTLIWDDDHRDRFQLDVYSGDARGDEAHYGAYGNPPYGDPFFEERKLPEVQRLDKQIADTVPNGQGLVDRIESTWLCAPKAFRYLERIILEIGAIGSGKSDVARHAVAGSKSGPPLRGGSFAAPAGRPTSILQCEDTIPDAASHKKWYDAFMASLTAWLDGARDARPELGEPTPARHWLVLLFRLKLRLYEKHDPFGNLIGAKSTGKRGTKTI